MKQGGLCRVTVTEGLVPYVEHPFFWFTSIEVTHDDADSVRIRRPMWSDVTQSFAQAPQGKLQLEVDVDNDLTLSPRLYVHNMVTALASNHVCHNSLFG